MKQKVKYDAQGNPIQSWEWGIITLITTVSILFVIFLTFSFIRLDRQLLSANNKLDSMTQRYDDLVYENEILWTYVENIDTFKSLDDAIEHRDNIYDLIQFIDE